MTDFETAIREALQSGMTISEIMANATGILNQIQQEEKERASSREGVIESLDREFQYHYQRGHLNLKDAITLLTIVEAEEHPDWTGEDIKQFMKMQEEVIPTNARLIKENPLAVLKETLEETLTQVMRVPQQEKSDSHTDRMTIEDFLKNL